MKINGEKLRQIRESHGLDREAVDDALGFVRRDTRFFETGINKGNKNRAPSRSSRKQFFMLCDLNGPPVISEMNDIVETIKRDFLWKKISALDTTKFGRSLILWDVDKNRVRTGTDLLALSNPERFTYFIDISDFGKP